ncbi:hypothetical protein ACWDV4_11560 [Micromonospora sp. NPDC003197]
MNGPDGKPETPPAVSTGVDGDLGATVVALSDGELGQAQRRRLLHDLIGQVRGRGLGDLFKPKAAIRWLVDTVSDIVPHIPIRDRETLRRHFDGLDDDALAERLIRNAARATAGIGAASGGVAAVKWAATPALLSAPVLLAAETVAVVAIEIKLVGELHEVYGVRFPGSGTQRAASMIHSWASQRGINPMVPGVGVGTVLGTAARNELRETLLRRFGRNLTTLGPFLTGAAVASYLNRRATRKLGDQIRTELRGRSGIEAAGPPGIIGAVGVIGAAGVTGPGGATIGQVVNDR